MIEMISILDNNPQVRRLYDLQLAAYAVEAERIGFDGIPALNESYEAFRSCGETFMIFRSEGETAGALSYEKEGQELTICRLVVDPSYFRRGIASRLLDELERRETSCTRILTSTGSANTPAVELYAKHGFSAAGEREVAPGVSITFFEKRMA